jgi:hypothetical protein
LASSSQIAVTLPPENAAKTHCVAGHPLAGANLLVLRRSDGRVERVCRTCARRRGELFRRRHGMQPRRPAAPKPPKPLKPPRPPRPPKSRPSRPAWQRMLARTTIVADGCWLWNGARSAGGYGIIQLGRGKGTTKAHRVSYEHFVGPITPGLDVMHRCHVPNCVNPAHLELGTRAENMAMSQRAGRLKRRHSATRTKTVPWS